MSSFANQNRSKVPETRVGTEGSAKRNITRKKTSSGGGGGGSKIKKGNIIDDGSLYTDPSALDENDPNYDSEEETGREFIPGSSPDRCDYIPELRTALKTAKMTLSEYKKSIEVAIEVRIKYYYLYFLLSLFAHLLTHSLTHLLTNLLNYLF